MSEINNEFFIWWDEGGEGNYNVISYLFVCFNYPTYVVYIFLFRIANAGGSDYVHINFQVRSLS